MLSAEPAGAAALAALKLAWEAELIDPDETVVLRATNTGLKNLQYLNFKIGAIEIDASIEEMQRAVEIG